MLFPVGVETYCSSQIQIWCCGSYKTIWSQQNPPADAGNSVNGSTCLQLVPVLTDVAAHQLPVIISWFWFAAAVGSSIEEVKLMVAVAGKPILRTSTVMMLPLHLHRNPLTDLSRLTGRVV